MNNRLWLTPCTLVAVVLLWSLGAHAQAQNKPAAPTSPAEFAPADAAGYLEVRDLATLREQFDKDPLTQLLRTHTPLGRQNREWAQIQALMGMRSPQLIDRYLGDVAGLVLDRVGEGAPGVILTRVTPEDTRHIVSALELQPDGQIANIDIHQSRDSKLRAAYLNSWLALTGGEHAPYFNELLQAATKGDTLAKSEVFNAWISRLPAERHVTLFARPDDGAVHAASLHRSDKGMTMHYAGSLPQLAGKAADLANDGKVNWGPLPSSTIAALAINVDGRRDMPANPLLDRLVMPKVFATDVKPHIGAPSLLFLGEVPGNSVTPAVDFAVPVLGIAFHMSNPAVAADLDLMFDRLMLWANVSTANWGVSQIALEKREGYQVANLGAPLAERTGRNELAPIRLTAGAVGDWYIVCTQDAFFQACQAANAGNKLSTQLASSRVADMPQGPVMMALHVKGQGLAKHLDGWVKHWQATDPSIFADGNAGNEAKPAPRRWRNETKVARWVKLASEAAAHFGDLDMQVVRVNDTQLEAGVNVQRK